MPRTLPVLAVAAISLACVPPAASGGASPAAGAPAARDARPAAAVGAWADSVLATLTLREKAAQMVWPWMLGDYTAEGTAAWERAIAAVERDEVGGLIISVGPPLEIAEKLNALQRRAPLPLLVGADFEAGAGFRARAGYFVPNGIDLGGATLFPPNMALGAARDTLLAYEQGRVTAVEGRALGVHLAFAPVLDVNNNAANPVIGARSFGETPALVAAMGRNLVRGLQAHGMIATGKHVPGHGDTEVNSHLSLPSVNVSRARLDSVELVPFRAAVDAGLGAMMTFHGAMPALDTSGAPGTLSGEVLTGLLREELGFGGLVISDAMDMRGVLDRYGAVEAAKRAVAAGADVLLQPVTVGETVDAIVAGVREGRYSEARVDASVRRLLQAKERLGLHRARAVPLDSVRARVGLAAHGAVAQRIADSSMTLVRDAGGLLPLRAGSAGTPRVLSITYARRADLAAGATFDAELRRHLPGLRSALVLAENPEAALARLALAADSADVVVVGSYATQGWDVAASTGEASPFVAFLRGLAERGRGPVLVSFGNPYQLQQVPRVGTYVVAWGGAPVSQRAAAQALVGRLPFAGRLPITIPAAE